MSFISSPIAFDPNTLAALFSASAMPLQLPPFGAFPRLSGSENDEFNPFLAAQLQTRCDLLLKDNEILRKKVAVLEQLLAPGVDAALVEEIRRSYFEVIWTEAEVSLDLTKKKSKSSLPMKEITARVSSGKAKDSLKSDPHEDLIEDLTLKEEDFDLPFDFGKSDSESECSDSESAFTSSETSSSEQFSDSESEDLPLSPSPPPSITIPKNTPPPPSPTTTPSVPLSPPALQTSLSANAAPFSPPPLPPQDFAALSQALIEEYKSDSNPSKKSPSERLLEFAETILREKEDHKIFSKDLVKLIKVLPDAHLAIGSKGKKSKLVSLLRTSDKFFLGKKVTKPKALVIIRERDFTDPKDEYERVKSPNTELNHYFSVNLRTSESLISAMVEATKAYDHVDMNYFYNTFSRDHRVTYLNRLFRFPSPKLLIRAILSWDGRFYWQKEGELITLRF